MSAIFIIIVSIHAPYAGSDTTPRVLCGIPSVSIHAPYAGSDFKVHERAQEIYEFQSTPPMQGATLAELEKATQVKVSIHAPYAGSD